MSLLSGEGRQIIERLIEAFKSPSLRGQEKKEPFLGGSDDSWCAWWNEAEIPGVVVKAAGCVLIGATLALGIVSGLIAIPPLLIGSVIAAVCGAHVRIGRRRQELEKDLPALLTSIASSVRAGVDPLIAVGGAREYFPDNGIMARELRRFQEAIAAGVKEEAVIEQFCAGIKHPDLPLFRSCLSLARRHGSSLADPLHRVTKVIRQRQSFRRKIRGALVMHRMSSVGIVLCALFIGIIQAAMNLDGIKQAIVHPVGGKVLIGGTSLIAAGVAWMMSLGLQRDS